MNLWKTNVKKPVDEKKHFFTQVRNYRISSVSTVAWGCVCPKCGAFHEFTDGDKWNFCPACGCSTKED